MSDSSHCRHFFERELFQLNVLWIHTMWTRSWHRESANSFVKYRRSIDKGVSSRETKVCVFIFLTAPSSSKPCRALYTCFRRTFNSQCCKCLFVSSEPTIKYVQRRFIEETTVSSAWLIHNIGIIAEPLCAPAKFVWKRFCCIQERRFVGAIQSCTVMRAVLSVIRWTSYKRIWARSVVSFVKVRLWHVSFTT